MVLRFRQGTILAGKLSEPRLGFAVSSATLGIHGGLTIVNSKLWKAFAAMSMLAMAVAWVAPASAQMSEVKEKPRMYSYVGFWSIPRAQWADMAKADAADETTLSKAMANGTIVGYGRDENLVHQPDEPTHDSWWSAMSMAGLMNVLDEFYKNGSASSPVLISATKHWDGIFVSRYYNWHPGSYKGVYGAGASYKLKADAPDDAIDQLSKNVIVPVMEKLLADGTIHEYEIDTEAVHTQAPGTFWIFYTAANAEALDKVNGAIRASIKAAPMNGAAFGSMVDMSAHRDYLSRSDATYK